MQINASDTVDCTHMDTAIFVTFDRPEPFFIEPGYDTLIGIFDTTDLTKVIGMTDFSLFAGLPTDVDFEYPKIPVQKYELSLTAINGSKNDTLHYYGISNTIPKTLPLPLEADFDISSANIDNFSVTFTGNKPSYYFTLLGSRNVSVTIYSCPDSSTMHPVSFLTGLKSKLLQSADINSLFLDEFGVDNVNGMSYSTYWPFIMAPTEPKHISWEASLKKVLL
jgi:hypothetical protein